MRLVTAAALVLSALGLSVFAVQAETPPVVRHSPEFVLKYNDGHQTLLSSYRGKVIALLFVHTTCPHCQHTSQIFTEYQKEYGPRGFQALDVAFNSMANLYVPDFVKTYGIGYPVSFAPPEQVMDYLKYSLMTRYVVPQIVWIDKRGDIRSQTSANGDDNTQYSETYWRNMIETLLKEPAGGAAHRTTTTHHVVRKKAPTT
jgi:thiol-disulfide isomerase/thioredoxin